MIPLPGEGAGRGPLVPDRARGSVGGLWAARHADLAAWQRPGLCAETYWGSDLPSKPCSP